MQLSPQVLKRVHSWLQPPFDEAVQEEIKNLIQKKPQEIEAAFSQDLSFGTGGMRAIMGLGSCRMNIYTVRLATQALSNYLKKQRRQNLKVFIGYDVRHHSQEFAEEAAKVLAANEIDVFLTKTIAPTPLVSFGCRFFHCDAAIMITASHNPLEYNGYKVYWNDGAQLVSPHDRSVVNEVKMTTNWQLTSLNSSKIHYVDESLDTSYYKALKTKILYPDLPKKKLKILYTNLHGTGIRLVPKALEIFGFSKLTLIEEQSSLDGNFPNAKSPNPEEKKALELGLNKMQQEGFDLLLATDPDADRVGVAVLHEKKAIQLTGNQVALLLLEHIARSLKEKNQLLPHSAAIKSVVTSSLFEKIANHYGISSFNVLTGFKYIAQKIREWEETKAFHFLFGAEESCGYLYTDFVRDKDGIEASCLIAEIAAWAKEKGQTLIDELYELYRKYGIYSNLLHSIHFEETIDGQNRVKKIMDSIRKNRLNSLAGQKIEKIIDYLKMEGALFSDMVEMQLEDQTKIILRPSGTEPKLKIYGEACSSFQDSHSEIEKAIQECDQKLNSSMNALLNLLSSDI